MGAITAFARAVTSVNAWIGRVVSYVVLILFVLLLGDVIMRYLTESPISWSAQASKLIFGVYAIIGGGYLLARREHVNVDLFYGSFSKKRKAAVDIATSFLFFCFLIVLLPNSYEMAAQSVCATEGVPPWCRWEVDELAVWKAPLWPSKWMIVVAAILLFAQGIVKFAADVMILMGIDVDETAYGPIADGAEGKLDV